MYDLLDSLGGPASAVMDFLESGLVYGSLLAIVTAILTVTLLRRARPAVIAVLWTIVLVKFAVPVGPATPLSLNGMLDAAVTQPDGPAVVSSTAAVTKIFASAYITVPVSASRVAWQLAQLLLMIGYFVAIGWIVARRIRSHWRLRRWVDGLAEPSGAQTRAVDAAAEAVGLRRAPALRVDPLAHTPAVVGISNPVLVLAGASDMSEPESEAVLIHEMAHLRRRDTWLRGLQLVVGTLLFFFPVVSWVNRRLDEARERACDEWALTAGRMSARDYARMLVRAARGPHLCAAGAVGLIAAPGQLERRVDGLLAGRPRPRVGRAAGLVIAVWAAFILGGTGAAEGHKATQRDNCVVDESLIDQILVEYPEADSDGDGRLSRKEICSHQLRMERRLTNDVARGIGGGDARVSWLDPVVDSNGDGVVSEAESGAVSQLVSETVRSGDITLDPVAFPGQVCEADAASACLEQE